MLSIVVVSPTPYIHRSPSTLYNLYELWRTYMSTENFAVNLFVDTYDQRQALYNTYTALCAFAHACSNSNMNMVSSQLPSVVILIVRI